MFYIHHLLEKIMDEEFEKEENTFLMIGRIFNNNNYANNKKFDTAIKVFNKLDTYKFKLDIIGSVKHIDFYNHLSNLIKDKNKLKFILIYQMVKKIIY